MGTILEFVGSTLNGAEGPAIDTSDGRAEAHRRALERSHLQGATLPWRKTFDDVRLRDGEVSLWAGYPGHGKTTMISQVALGLVRQGLEVRVFSLEMPTPLLRQTMYYQLAGGDSPTAAWLDAADRWLEPMSFVHTDDLLTPGQLAGHIEDYLMGDIRRHVVVDNLSFISMPEKEEGVAVRAFMREMKRLAETHKAHVHLLMHLRKGMNETRPGVMDIAGSRHYSGLAHNAFLCWRNKAKQEAEQLCPEAVAALTEREAAKREQLLAGPDTLLFVEKQREHTYTGKIALWLDRPSRQFCSGPERRVQQFGITPGGDFQ